MKITLLSVGSRMPAWVDAGVAEYAKRLPAEFSLQLSDVPLARRGKGQDVELAVRKEAEALLSRVRPQEHVIALEVTGLRLSTEALAQRLDAIRRDGRNIVLLVGGPDGLGEACLQRADEKWSLSTLTLPHPLVRIVVAEQVYRAWTVLNAHPYHRA
jgi:23S rRNA (pseudouridine1915-N3)-methyltransferase